MSKPAVYAYAPIFELYDEQLKDPNYHGTLPTADEMVAIVKGFYESAEKGRELKDQHTKAGENPAGTIEHLFVDGKGRLAKLVRINPYTLAGKARIEALREGKAVGTSMELELAEDGKLDTGKARIRKTFSSSTLVDNPDHGTFIEDFDEDREALLRRIFPEQTDPDDNKSGSFIDASLKDQVQAAWSSAMDDKSREEEDEEDQALDGQEAQKKQKGQEGKEASQKETEKEAAPSDPMDVDDTAATDSKEAAKTALTPHSPVQGTSMSKNESSQPAIPNSADSTNQMEVETESSNMQQQQQQQQQQQPGTPQHDGNLAEELRRAREREAELRRKMQAYEKNRQKPETRGKRPRSYEQSQTDFEQGLNQMAKKLKDLYELQGLRKSDDPEDLLKYFDEDLSAKTAEAKQMIEEYLDFARNALKEYEPDMSDDEIAKIANESRNPDNSAARTLVSKAANDYVNGARKLEAKYQRGDDIFGSGAAHRSTEPSSATRGFHVPTSTGASMGPSSFDHMRRTLEMARRAASPASAYSPPQQQQQQQQQQQVSQTTSYHQPLAKQARSAHPSPALGESSGYVKSPEQERDEMIKTLEGKWKEHLTPGTPIPAREFEERYKHGLESASRDIRDLQCDPMESDLAADTAARFWDVEPIRKIYMHLRNEGSSLLKKEGDKNVDTLRVPDFQHGAPANMGTMPNVVDSSQVRFF